MSRKFLHAYFKTQAAHKSIHRLSKAFEVDASEEQILTHLAIVENYLKEIRSLLDR